MSSLQTVCWIAILFERKSRIHHFIPHILRIDKLSPMPWWKWQWTAQSMLRKLEPYRLPMKNKLTQDRNASHPALLWLGNDRRLLNAIKCLPTSFHIKGNFYETRLTIVRPQVSTYFFFLLILTPTNGCSIINPLAVLCVNLGLNSTPLILTLLC